MDRVVRIPRITPEQRDRAARSYRWVASQPSWIVRLALLIFLLIVGLPILILVGLAIFAATIVFTGFALMNVALIRLRGILPKRDGRSNVRVIKRD